MKRNAMLALALFVATVPAAPALAGWKLVNQGTAVAVAKSAMTVTPAESWNRSSVRPIKKSEVWSLDGIGLNELYFVSGLIAGETLYRDPAKKERPLPTLGKSMQLTDIPEFFESSNRIALQTSVFSVTGVEPTRFGGHDGVKFSFQYAVAGSTMTRNGIASATIVDDKLYLISFIAPTLTYFERDRQKAEAIIASARF